MRSSTWRSSCSIRRTTTGSWASHPTLPRPARRPPSMTSALASRATPAIRRRWRSSPILSVDRVLREMAIGAGDAGVLLIGTFDLYPDESREIRLGGAFGALTVPAWAKTSGPPWPPNRCARRQLAGNPPHPPPVPPSLPGPGELTEPAEPDPVPPSSGSVAPNGSPPRRCCRRRGGGGGRRCGAADQRYVDGAGDGSVAGRPRHSWGQRHRRRGWSGGADAGAGR